MGWNYLSIPKLQRLHRWSLGMDKQFHPIFYNGCNYLSMLGLKLNHVSKRGHRYRGITRFDWTSHLYTNEEQTWSQLVMVWTKWGERVHEGWGSPEVKRERTCTCRNESAYLTSSKYRRFGTVHTSRYLHIARKFTLGRHANISVGDKNKNRVKNN